MVYKTTYKSPIGLLTLTSDGENLIALYNKDIVGEEKDLPIFDKTKDWLKRYFAGKQPGVKELPLAPEGTEFRKKVWKALCEIPYGCLVTYGDIGKQIGCKSGQAVGGAVGNNPISIIIPCHRVVGGNKSLTGYGGGLKMKVALLEHEGIDTKKYAVPTKEAKLYIKSQNLC
ncbi:MAG: methylated-DNA--[protein]-cysteine S-methyltransferase [Firmicutes bacterium]|nr:methylated-DNA--[protein]-cysteine S-methyltransferase [Bacillota bacterium]MCL2770971.1 methylated-DNA--[protein]-cysteine S-methyltransferase [Bacillota bacterium]